MRAPIGLPSHVNLGEYCEEVSTHFGAIVLFAVLVSIGIVETGSP